MTTAQPFSAGAIQTEALRLWNFGGPANENLPLAKRFARKSLGERSASFFCSFSAESASPRPSRRNPSSVACQRKARCWKLGGALRFTELFLLNPARAGIRKLATTIGRQSEALRRGKSLASEALPLGRMMTTAQPFSAGAIQTEALPGRPGSKTEALR